MSIPRFVAALLAAVPVLAQPPEPVRELVVGLKVRPSEQLDLGFPARALRDATGNPQLVWSEEAARALRVPHSRERAQRWIDDHGRAFGHTGLRARFLRASQWLGLDAWHYELELDGVVLFDAEITLYWQGERCLGIANRCPKIAALPALPEDKDGLVLYAPPGHDGTVLIAQRRVTSDATHTTTEIVQGGKVRHRMLEQRSYAVQPAAATITEYLVPGGMFPDQIWADSKGKIWFSDPNLNLVYVFNPVTNAFQSYPTVAASVTYRQPDGLFVDDQDRVWTGLYTANDGLGSLDTITGTFRRYAAPYTGAQMAIPMQSGHGTIYVTDHAANRVSELDVKTGTWLRSEQMPTATYPVGGVLEPETDDAYFPLYSYHGLAKLSPGTPITRIAAPSLSGPSFAGAHDGKIYFTYWNANKLGEYDTKAKTFVEYVYRAGELGGPMAMGPNGHAYVGTRGTGYIEVFDPVTKTFAEHKVPSAATGMKDGLTVAPDGVVWFTEPSLRKIARLVLP